MKRESSPTSNVRTEPGRRRQTESPILPPSGISWRARPPWRPALLVRALRRIVEQALLHDRGHAVHPDAVAGPLLGTCASTPSTSPRDDACAALPAAPPPPSTEPIFTMAPPRSRSDGNAPVCTRRPPMPFQANIRSPLGLQLRVGGQLARTVDSRPRCTGRSTPTQAGRRVRRTRSRPTPFRRSSRVGPRPRRRHIVGLPSWTVAVPTRAPRSTKRPARRRRRCPPAPPVTITPAGECSSLLLLEIALGVVRERVVVGHFVYGWVGANRSRASRSTRRCRTRPARGGSR